MAKEKMMCTLVIPCYNEGKRLDVARFFAFLEQEEGVRFLFVDDGSTDNTVERIREVEQNCPDRVHLLLLEENGGKAEAVRQGMLEAVRQGASKVGFWDADLATPLDELSQFRAVFERDSSIEMVCGSRVQRLGSDISRHWYRHYPGRLIATFISIILGIKVYDSQCGAKVFSSGLAGVLFAEPFLSPWLFDVELFARMIGQYGRKHCLHAIFELPLTCWHDVGGSKISPVYMVKVPMELFRIAICYRKQLQ